MTPPVSPPLHEGLVLEYELDAPPQKVWRAISIPEYREAWLPGQALAQAEPVSSEAPEQIRYRLRDPAPPFLESQVTFQIRPNDSGGTTLTIIHEPPGTTSSAAANDDAPYLLLAA
ncbi:SRPBCC family protein [Alcaligenes sp. Marseille-Q7550]